MVAGTGPQILRHAFLSSWSPTAVSVRGGGSEWLASHEEDVLEATCVASLSVLGQPPPRPEDSPAAHGEVCVAQGPRGRLPTADADLTGMGGSLAGSGPSRWQGPQHPAFGLRKDRAKTTWPRCPRIPDPRKRRGVRDGHGLRS